VSHSSPSLPFVRAASGRATTPSLAQAKRRARRRARQGGAVVFIVSMTIGVLVSLGAFALISAATEIKSAGYERQSMQAHYLAEFAMVATAQKLDPYNAQAIALAATDYNPAYPRNHCTSLETVPATASAKARQCKRLGMLELAQGWVGISPTAPLRVSSLTAPGSLGAVALEGNFAVEVTDMMLGQTSGNGMANSTCSATFTITTFGQTKPSVAYAGANTTQIYGASTVEEGRGLLTGGPISSPGCQ
jgi:hypothetical protein